MRSKSLSSAFAAVVALATGGGLVWAGVLGDAGTDAPPKEAGPVAEAPDVALPTTSPDDVPDDPTPSVAPSLPPVPADREVLAADLAALAADEEFDTGSMWALVVLDEYGRPVFEQDPELGLLPASTMKLVTSAAAMRLHGATGRIRTPVLIDGEVTPGGTLLGNVVLMAAGDPSLTSEAYRRFIYPARPAADIADVADLLQRRGIERILGDVVADPGPFADQRIPSGWRDAYLAEFDGRHITGLTVDAGLEVQVAFPRSSWADLGPEQIEDGVRIDQADDPLVEAASVAYREIVARGITIDGTSRAGTAGPDAETIGTLYSPRVRDLLAFMTKQSDNHVADTFFREIGAVVTGRSTWDSSADAVRLLLADLAVDVTGATLADGSGLSRDDRLTARLLAQLDLAMTNSDVGREWASFQAVAGEDGTLRRRLDGTIADGRFRGKTGTLDDVRALAGAVEGPDGTRYHLAMLGNGGEVWRLNALADRIVLRLTESLWCRVADQPDTPANVAAHCAAIAPSPSPTDSASPSDSPSPSDDDA